MAVGRSLPSTSRQAHVSAARHHPQPQDGHNIEGYQNEKVQRVLMTSRAHPGPRNGSAAVGTGFNVSLSPASRWSSTPSDRNLLTIRAEDSDLADLEFLHVGLLIVSIMTKEARLSQKEAASVCDTDLPRASSASSSSKSGSRGSEDSSSSPSFPPEAYGLRR